MQAPPAIRIARDLSDVEACVELQRTVWKRSDLDVTGPLQLLAGIQAGGLLMVVEDTTGVIGFSYAFPALEGGEVHLHSDMLAVRADAREHGLGTRLKWAQRREALRQGIKLITWAFDPLQVGYARLSLRRLGATATGLRSDTHGTAPSAPLQEASADRLSVRWELESPSVKDRSGGTPPAPAARWLDAPRVLDVAWDGDRPVPSAPRLDLDETVLLLEVPADADGLLRASSTAAREWRGRARQVLGELFARGYRVVDLLTIKERGRPRPLYVLYRFPT